MPRYPMLLVALAFNLVPGCGDDAGPQDRQPADPVIVDWKKGTYKGVRLGDSTSRAVRLLGRPVRRGHDEPVGPIEDAGGVLPNYSSPDIGRRIADFEILSYQRWVIDTTGGRVTAWGTAEPGAETPEGIGVGDDPELVDRRYRIANCYTGKEGHGYIDYPHCQARVCRGRLLGFVGDPIKSVWLAATTKYGLNGCSRPLTRTGRRQEAVRD